MARRKRDHRIMDLFADYEPPAVVVAFEPEQVRAQTINGRIARAVSQALSDSLRSRDEIADRMGEFLGERVSKLMLNNYASQAKEEHRISAARLAALAHATDDVRVLAVLVEPFEYAVIPERYVHAAEDAMLADQIEELARMQKTARSRWKAGR